MSFPSLIKIDSANNIKAANKDKASIGHNNAVQYLRR